VLFASQPGSQRSSSPSWYWSNSGNFCIMARLRHAGKEPNFELLSV